MVVENKTKGELLKQLWIGLYLEKIEVQICAIINMDEANYLSSTRCEQKDGVFWGRSYDS
jgi:hypothetical protein